MAAAWMERSRALAPYAGRSAIRTLQLLTALHLFTTDILEIRLCSGYSMLPTLSHDGDFVLISPLHVNFHKSSSSLASTKSTYSSDPSSSSSSSSSTPLLRSLIPRFDIQRGDLVIATSPTDPYRTVCKRIIGLEGDIIEVDPSKTSRALAKAKEEEESGEKRWEEIDAEHRSALARMREKERDSAQQEEEEAGNLVDLFHQAVEGGGSGRRGGRRKRKTDLDGSEHIRIPRGHVWLAGDNMSNSTDSRTYGPVALGLLKGKVLARVWPNPKWIESEIRTLPDVTDT